MLIALKMQINTGNTVYSTFFLWTLLNIVLKLQIKVKNLSTNATDNDQEYNSFNISTVVVFVAIVHFLVYMWRLRLCSAWCCLSW